MYFWNMGCLLLAYLTVLGQPRKIWRETGLSLLLHLGFSQIRYIFIKFISIFCELLGREEVDGAVGLIDCCQKNMIA